jgi:hypothetical protein
MSRLLLATNRNQHAYKRFLGAAATFSLTGYVLHESKDAQCDEYPKVDFSRSSSMHDCSWVPFLAPTRTTMDAATATAAAPTKTVDYDFIIMGHGNAGHAAAETLRRQCPSATICIVDPLRPSVPRSNVDYLPQSVLGFHPPTQMVQLVNDSSTQLHYKHAILIATGVRGAPPPMSLVDPKALPRVLELRSTATANRPILAPHTTRQLCLMAASQGAKVAVMGSGWDAVELAVAATIVGSSDRGGAVLTFGGAGPLSLVMPRYLSTSITKRLQQQGVEVRDRTLVMYVSHKQHDSKLELHAARSYDIVDTKRHLIDLLVVAPAVDGPRGTAILPSLALPEHLDPSSDGTSWYQSWSQLTAPLPVPSMCVCYADDGRVMVNAELNVASRVYAAGSVAKFPNSVTGHGHVAGEGTVDGRLAGQVAAMHMARDYHERVGGVMFGRRRHDISMTSFAAESFPVWRSDMISYVQGQDAYSSSLSKVGVQALCVGVCDSEKMTTHGFWWTNQAANTALLREANMSRRSTKRNGDMTPVYGVGAVFYFDRSGRVCGVMIWGLPFTGDSKEELNETLLNRMKDFITSNGNITNYKQEASAHLMPRHLADESKLLVQLALHGKTPNNHCLRRLHGLSIEDMPRPLHQYTAAKPCTVQTMGRLRRGNQEKNSEVLGEHLYIKDEDEALDGNIRPSSLVYVYPLRPRSSTSRDDWKNPFEMTAAERVAEAWEENEHRARPPKEEPLWLRHGEVARTSNVQESMLDMFLKNMKKGVFSDGQDPIFRPDHIPSPDFMRVSDRFRGWMKSEAEAGKVPDDRTQSPSQGDPSGASESSEDKAR